MSSSEETLPIDASARQARAARPDRSTWLSANAGSGKTKVLTDRVARLLLRGCPPERILCLTYTKAAAAEMQNRLFDRLGAWAMMPETALRDTLRDLDPEAQLDGDALRHARTLFAAAVETPGGLKIQTIHSFCGGLLRRFPLEARVSPQYREMDERSRDALISDALEDVIQTDARDVVDAIARFDTSGDLVAIANAVMQNREGFAEAITPETLRDWFEIPEGCTPQTVVEDTFAGFNSAVFETMTDVLGTSNKPTDKKLHAALLALDKVHFSVDSIRALQGVLLFGENTAKGSFVSKRDTIPTKELRLAHQEVFAPLGELCDRIERARPLLNALEDAARAHALHRFAGEIIGRVEAKKAHLGFLDFDDMIRKARDLLDRPETAQWVLFRLDGGIDHILVDEAQDTSPDQWHVVRRLAEEFAAGMGARTDVKRTIFVVGDVKQSIYSFQGADPSGFGRMREFFKSRLAAVEDPLQELSLEHSFRSSPAILDVVDRVFAASGGYGIDGPTHHISFFDETPGRVDLWPLIEPVRAQADEEDWSDTQDHKTEEHHNFRLAARIADQIAEMLENGSIPAKDGVFRAIEPRDILILVKRRSGLFMPILLALKKRGLPIAGADLLTLDNELAVRDMRALLSFLALEDDDLALAEALKSPLFNWSEKDLFDLAHDRQEATLWRELRARRADWPETFAILDDLRLRTDYLRPYELIERILIRHGGRRKFLARLGDEAEDGLDVLLHMARSYERGEVPSLTGFLAWLDADQVKLKRVLDEGTNLIRMMTVHGAKGLEAPIVIMPDTFPSSKESTIKDEVIALEEGRLAWNCTGNGDGDAMARAKAQIKEKARQELQRLLYVAMTRAEKWLIVAGVGTQKAKERSWYGQIEAALGEVEAQALPFDADGHGLRYQVGAWQTAARGSDEDVDAAGVLPDWAVDSSQIQRETPVYLSPSDLGGAKALAGEEAGRTAEDAKRRGRQIHVLIDALWQVAPKDRAAAAARVLCEGEDAILAHERDALLAEVSGVLDASYDWDVFAADSLSEVPFTSVIPGLEGDGVHGVIDRMIVTPEQISIVDYKTNAVVPERVEDVPEGLLRQLGAYGEVAAQLYGGRDIRVALLWTQTATLMTIPLDIVREALRRTTTS